MTSADAQAHLRNGIAMGANRAIHVVTDQAIQPLTAARTLMKLIELFDAKLADRKELCDRLIEALIVAKHKADGA